MFICVLFFIAFLAFLSSRAPPPEGNYAVTDAQMDDAQIEALNKASATIEELKADKTEAFRDSTEQMEKRYEAEDESKKLRSQLKILENSPQIVKDKLVQRLYKKCSSLEAQLSVSKRYQDYAYRESTRVLKRANEAEAKLKNAYSSTSKPEKNNNATSSGIEKDSNLGDNSVVVDTLRNQSSAQTQAFNSMKMRYEQQLEEKAATINMLRADLSSKDDGVKALRVENDNLTTDVQIAHEAHSGCRERMEDQVRLVNERNATIQEQDASLESVNAKLIESNTAHSGCQESLEEVTAQGKDLETANNELKEELEKASNMIGENLKWQNAALVQHQKDLNAVQTELKTLQNAHAKCAESMDVDPSSGQKSADNDSMDVDNVDKPLPVNIVREIRGLRKQVRQLQSDLQQSQNDAQEYKNTLEKKGNDDTEMHDSFEDHTVCEAKIRSRESTINQLNRDAATHKRHNGLLNKDLGEISGNFRVAEKQIDDLKRERDQLLQQKRCDAMTNSLRDKVKSLDRQLEGMTAEKKRSQNTNIAHNQQNQRISTNLTQVQAQLAQEQSTVTGLNTHISHLNKRITELLLDVAVATQGGKAGGSGVSSKEKKRASPDYETETDREGPSKMPKAEHVPAATDPAPSDPQPGSSATSSPPNNINGAPAFPTGNDHKAKKPSDLPPHLQELHDRKWGST